MFCSFGHFCSDVLYVFFDMAVDIVGQKPGSPCSGDKEKFPN